MNLKIIQERLDAYRCRTQTEEECALAEIVQEIILLALTRNDFFKKAAFQGGTCLRIIYGLPRFSEDLDFICNGHDMTFEWQYYLKAIVTEFSAYGIELTIQDRSTVDKTIKKAFIKTDSLGKILLVKQLWSTGKPKVTKIKLEIDVNPPMGSISEIKYLDFPIPFPVVVQDMPSLFAGKCHAILCREYAKGRDWFDFVWYSARKTNLNMNFLTNAIDQIGPWKDQGVRVGKKWFIDQVERKIGKMNWLEAQKDVVRFLKPQDVSIVSGWNREFFLERLKLVEGNIN